MIKLTNVLVKLMLLPHVSPPETLEVMMKLPVHGVCSDSIKLLSWLVLCPFFLESYKSTVYNIRDLCDIDKFIIWINSLLAGAICKAIAGLSLTSANQLPYALYAILKECFGNAP